MNDDETPFALGGEGAKGVGEGRKEGDGLILVGTGAGVGGGGGGGALVSEGIRQQAISTNPTNKQLLRVRKIFIL